MQTRVLGKTQLHEAHLRCVMQSNPLRWSVSAAALRAAETLA